MTDSIDQRLRRMSWHQTRDNTKTSTPQVATTNVGTVATDGVTNARPSSGNKKGKSSRKKLMMKTEPEDTSKTVKSKPAVVEVTPASTPQVAVVAPSVAGNEAAVVPPAAQVTSSVRPVVIPGETEDSINALLEEQSRK